MLDNLPFFVLAGFAAQMVDGALGMAYGVTLTTLLLSLGLSPVVASSSVHAAEVVITGVSGAFHLRFGNVDRALFKRLVIPGMVGGGLGAYVLTAVPSEVIKPFVGYYLLVMGVVILVRVVKNVKISVDHPILLRILGFIGGLFDAIGGGGWGPIVTSTLIAGGRKPRFVIGSVNAAEFFVTVVESIIFLLIIGLGYWQIVLSIIIGGVLAAPLAAHVCKVVPAKPVMVLVGILIIVLSARML